MSKYNFYLFKNKLLRVTILSVALVACTNAGTTNFTPEELASATFSIHMVRNETESPEAIQLAKVGKLPPGAAYYPSRKNVDIIVEKRTKITQDCLKNVSAGVLPLTNSPILNFSFDDECAALIEKVTKNNIGQKLAIIINDEMVLAPRISAPISGGSGYVDGYFTQEEINRLSRLLTGRIKRNKLKSKKKAS